jgi:hypothetical protein
MPLPPPQRKQFLETVSGSFVDGIALGDMMKRDAGHGFEERPVYRK